MISSAELISLPAAWPAGTHMCGINFASQVKAQAAPAGRSAAGKGLLHQDQLPGYLSRIYGKISGLKERGSGMMYLVLLICLRLI